MFKLLIIADLSKKDILASTIEYFAGNDVHIDLLSIYEPRPEEAVSIINLNDIVYREKVKNMGAFIATQKNINRFYKDFNLLGKVRLGKIYNLLHDQLSKNIYNGVLLLEDMPKSKIRKLSIFKTPLFSLVKSEYSDHITFENITPISTDEGFTGNLFNLNASRKKGGFKLDIPTSATDFS